MSERDALALSGYVDGIDVSQVQTITDPAAVYAAGFRFAFVKASEGLSYRDPACRRHLDALAGAGLLVGAYGFARFSQGQPRAQVRALYDAATSDGKHMVRLVLDLENCPTGTAWSALRDFADEYMSELRLSGSLPVLYTMGSWVPHLTGLDVPVWVAQYRSVTQAWAPSQAEADAFFAAREGVYLWQYSGDKGYRVPGVVGDCDRNLYHGDEASLREWFGLAP